MKNICPATDKYIKEIYVDINNIPVKIDNRIAQDIIINARNVLANKIYLFTGYEKT